MLLDVLLTKYNWLITNVPEVLLSNYDFDRWVSNLTPYELANFRMNVSGIEQSKSMVEDEIDNYAPETEEFERLIGLHTRLIMLLFVIKVET